MNLIFENRKQQQKYLIFNKYLIMKDFVLNINAKKNFIFNTSYIFLGLIN
jgi:hypothetical protein